MSTPPAVDLKLNGNDLALAADTLEELHSLTIDGVIPGGDGNTVTLVTRGVPAFELEAELKRVGITPIDTVTIR